MGRARATVHQPAARAARDRAAAETLALVERHHREAHWRSKPLFARLRRPEVLFDPDLTCRRLIHSAKLQGDRNAALIRFRRQTGESLWRYVESRRLEVALRLLLGTELLLGWVAELAGFSSERHLRSLCRRRFGAPPSQLRRAGEPPRPATPAAGPPATGEPGLPPPVLAGIAAVARELRRTLRQLPAAERQALRKVFRFHPRALIHLPSEL